MMSAGDPPPSASPLRVFLLEDDVLLRDRVLVPRLRQFGFEVTPFGYGAELEAELESSRPDIIVIDAGLPDRDGFAMTRQLHAHMADVGIVMLTARGENTDRVRGLSEGADAYLTKPVDIDLLTATLYSLARRLRPRVPSSVPRPQGIFRSITPWPTHLPFVTSISVPASRAPTPTGTTG